MGVWRRPGRAAAAVVAVAAAIGITVGVTGCSGGSASSTGPASPASSGSPGGSAGPGGSGGLTRRVCQQIVVPAYFNTLGDWSVAVGAKPPPADIILDISGVGAGSAPQPEFQALVRDARAAGVTVLGYISTVDGQRPADEVRADVRHYAAWYGVTSIFLDRVSGQPQQVSYYQQLAGYIHRAHPGAEVWLNPGFYPDQRYASIGDVIMAFEGTYAQYLPAEVPGWARRYPAAKFAHTIYATPRSDLGNALRLAAGRNAAHVYVTDGSGSNPYQALPGYWTAENAATGGACPGPR